MKFCAAAALIAVAIFSSIGEGHRESDTIGVVALQDGFSASGHEKATDSDALSAAAAEVAPLQVVAAKPDVSTVADKKKENAVERADAQPTDHEEEERSKMPADALPRTNDPGSVTEWDLPTLGEVAEQVPLFFHPSAGRDDSASDLGEEQGFPRRLGGGLQRRSRQETSKAKLSHQKSVKEFDATLHKVDRKEKVDPHEQEVAQRESYENRKQDRSMGTNAGLSTSGGNNLPAGGFPNFGLRL